MRVKAPSAALRAASQRIRRHLERVCRVRFPSSLTDAIARTRKFGRSARYRESAIARGIHARIFTPMRTVPIARDLPGFWLVYCPEKGAEFLALSCEVPGALLGITSNVKRYFAEPLRYFDGGRIPPLRNHGDRRRDYRRLVPGGFRGPIGPGEAEILKPMWFLLAVLPERGEQYCGHIFEHYGRRGGWEAEVRRLFRKVEDLGEARRWDRLARWLLRRRMYAQAQGALENLRAIQYAAWGPTGEIQPGTPVTRWFQGSVRQQIAVAGELKDLPGERVLRSILKSLRTCRRDLPDAPWRPRGVGGVVDYLRSVGAWRGPADLRIVKPDARPPGSDGFFRRLDPAGFGVPSVDP